MTRISVVIPVYKGEDYLRQTLTSLGAQSFTDFEVLCVDDCSPDSSSDIIQEFAECDPRVRYLRTEQNLGIAPKVMNFAAPYAVGDYFVYSSQDDLFSADWLEKMHQRALDTGADAVLPNVEFSHEGGSENRKLVGYHGDTEVVISGRDAFLSSLKWEISGNALWRMKLLKDIGYFDFGTFADEFTVRYFFLRCEAVAFCDAVFFYRQDNPNAITKTPSAKLLDAPHNHFMIWKLIVDSGFGADIHGPYALETLRSLIKAQALLFSAPDLREHRHKIDSQFQDLKTTEFKASLKTVSKQRVGRGRKVSYLFALRSRLWLNYLSRASLYADRLKTFRRNIRAK
ncbi:glycosyltransferase family 2 protein [Roseovarius sp. S1116L3]|uniref:glycosyltransferase family 2 protein n=1 Tax=Roseovarius roseus TaxID=3342636 RepID=UPI00372B40B3